MQLTRALWQGTTDSDFDDLLTSHGFLTFISASAATLFSLEEMEWLLALCQRPEVIYFQQCLPMLVREAEFRAAKWISHNVSMTEMPVFNLEAGADIEMAHWASIMAHRPWTPAYDLRLSDDDIRFPKRGCIFNLRDILENRIERRRSHDFFVALRAQAGKADPQPFLNFLNSADGDRYLRMLHRLTGTCWGFIELLEAEPDRS